MHIKNLIVKQLAIPHYCETIWPKNLAKKISFLGILRHNFESNCNRIHQIVIIIFQFFSNIIVAINKHDDKLNYHNADYSFYKHACFAITKLFPWLFIMHAYARPKLFNAKLGCIYSVYTQAWQFYAHRISVYVMMILFIII